MKKNRILLTTYCGNNYGSLLQAFAMVKSLEKLGFNVTIIEEKPFIKGEPLSTLLHIFKIALFHPVVFTHFLRARKIANKINISNEQIENFNYFKENFLPIKIVTFREAKKDASQPNIHKCVCGSDQIWNGEAINLKRFYFLTFSKREHNLAYAPSFGRENVASYNYKKYKKLIKNIGTISLREPNFLVKTENIVCDPTLFFC